MKVPWPKGPTGWIDAGTLYVSIPFTWNLPDVRTDLLAGSFFWDKAVVGGPAVRLMPDYLGDLPSLSSRFTIGGDMPGVLQRVNPQATRTTVGCPNRCDFCGVSRIEPEFRELADWPDLPIIADNNLLAASMAHFERVIERLVRHAWADFNQGLDPRLLTPEHARLLAEIRDPMIRLALDDMQDAPVWEQAFDFLRDAGIPKRNIRSYCLVGFRDTPKEAWARCRWVESHGVKPLPMWYHRMVDLKHNTVNDYQAALGWTDAERRRLMGWFYQHRTPDRGRKAESP